MAKRARKGNKESTSSCESSDLELSRRLTPEAELAISNFVEATGIDPIDIPEDPNESSLFFLKIATEKSLIINSINEKLPEMLKNSKSLKDENSRLRNERDAALDELELKASNDPLSKVLIPTADAEIQTSPIEVKECTFPSVDEEMELSPASAEPVPQAIHVEIGKKTKEKIPKKKLAIQCFKCQRFGHIAKNCLDAPRCRICGKDHNSRECVSNSDAPIAISCANCHGNHKSSSKTCPAFPKSSVPKATAPTKSEQRKKKKSTHSSPLSRNVNRAGAKSKKTKAPNSFSNIASILQEFSRTQAAIVEFLMRHEGKV